MRFFATAILNETSGEQKNNNVHEFAFVTWLKKGWIKSILDNITASVFSSQSTSWISGHAFLREEKCHW